MSDYKEYRKELKENEIFFDKRISDRQNKAYEYGVMVVKNSVIISGGGLLAIPAIVGLNTNMNIDIGEITKAGFAFACGLFLSILATYVVHWNWSLHAQAWEKYWEDRREFLKKLYIDDIPNEEINFESKEHFSNLITWTYVLPHILAILYLISVGYGFLRLYAAMGVSG